MDVYQPTKECPDCKSQVPADAKVCRHCRHRFGARQRFWGVAAGLALVATVAAVTGEHRAVSPQQPQSAIAPLADQPPPRRASSADPKIDALLSQQAKLDDDCRGGDVTPDSKVCVDRDKIDAQLSKAGWCYGEPGEAGAEEAWHDCVAAEAAPVSDRHRKWVEQCESAILTDLNDPKSADFPILNFSPESFAHAQLPDSGGGPDPTKVSAAALNAWTAQHPEFFSERISFDFHAKNLMGGVQRYTATCTFLDNFDGTTKLTDHAVGTD